MLDDYSPKRDTESSKTLVMMPIAVLLLLLSLFLLCGYVVDVSKYFHDVDMHTLVHMGRV